MISVFRNLIIICVAFIAHYSIVSAAEKNVDVISGKIKTILAKQTVTVFLIDTDGSILDISGLDKEGNYQMDATILDEPIYDKVRPLDLVFKDKKGREKKVKITSNIGKFSNNKIQIIDLVFP